MQKICRTCRKVFGSSDQFCPDHQGYLVLHSLVGDLLLGRYRVTETIGVGLDSLVCLGVDEQLGYKVAIKALLLDPDGYRFVVNRFLREAKTYAALTDPRFPRVFARNMLQDGRPYFVFEWIDGESLEETLDKERRLVAPLAVRLAMEVAAGLQQAHSHGFVHLDVTPSNILRYQDATSTEHVKIIDFGIVRVTPAVTAQDERFRRPLGNPPYMSPEQWRRQELDARTDVWSLGVTLYELLSGRLPFGDDDWEAVRRRTLHEPAPPLRTLVLDDRLPVHIPDALEDLVMSMIEKDPARRPRSMIEVHLALRGQLKELEPDAMPYARFLSCFDEAPLLDEGRPRAANDDASEGALLPIAATGEPSLGDVDEPSGLGAEELWSDAYIPTQVYPGDPDYEEPLYQAEIIAVEPRWSGLRDTVEGIEPPLGRPSAGPAAPIDAAELALERDAILEIRPLGDGEGAPPEEPFRPEEIEEAEEVSLTDQADDTTPVGAGRTLAQLGDDPTRPDLQPSARDLDVVWAAASGSLSVWPEPPALGDVHGEDANLHDRDTDPGHHSDTDPGRSVPLLDVGTAPAAHQAAAAPGDVGALGLIQLPEDDFSQVGVVGREEPGALAVASRRWTDRQLGAAVVLSLLVVALAVGLVFNARPGMVGPQRSPGLEPLLAAGILPTSPEAPRVLPRQVPHSAPPYVGVSSAARPGPTSAPPAPAPRLPTASAPELAAPALAVTALAVTELAMTAEPSPIALRSAPASAAPGVSTPRAAAVPSAPRPTASARATEGSPRPTPGSNPARGASPRQHSQTAKGPSEPRVAADKPAAPSLTVRDPASGGEGRFFPKF